MELSDLLRAAWSAVEESRVPADQRSVAFREAISILRDSYQPVGPGADNKPPANARKGTGARKRASSSRRKPADDGATAEVPSESEFFSRLADESDVPETDLRDVLQVTASGDVHVLPATRVLGDSKAHQTKTVVALVAGARGYGLEESPVDGKKVLIEVQRKKCHNTGNYAATVGSLKGLNTGPNRTMVLTSKWLEDFKPAVERALGRSGDSS